MAVLYRKYRPQSFKEIIGQDHVIKTLKNSISSNNFSHAYLFCGPRGSGKTTIARLFAKAINCTKLDEFEPCNKCDSCTEITAGKALDLIEIDAASHTGVDEIRELIEGIKFSPVKSKYKIFIIDECHQLSKSAVNALLKTLEEPPAHAIFILATTEAHKMIPTIVSRCQRFDFKKLQIPEIIKKLDFIAKKEGVKFDESALSLIALNSRGSFRDAESLLDEVISFSGKTGEIKAENIEELLGVVDVQEVSTFLDFVLDKKSKDAILFVNQILEKGTDLNEFAKSLVLYLRELILLKIDKCFVNSQNSGLSESEIGKLSEQSEKITGKDAQIILEKFIEAENKMKYSSIVQLPLELAIIDICE